MKLKLVTIVGTRPEIIKLSQVIKKCDSFFEHKIIHTGQNYDYELNQIFFEDLDIRKPDFFLEVSGKNLGESIGNVISKTYDILDNIKPDCILILGDTNSCLSAISAKRLKIPIFHLEAGNRCFDQRVPEELNRKIVDHLSDINMPLTEQARDYLISEGIRPETVIKIGSCMKEILSYYKSEISNSSILKQLKLSKNKFFVVSAHREENVDYKNNLIELLKSLNQVAEQYKLPVIISTHPRTQNRIDQDKYTNYLDQIKDIQNIIKYVNFDYIIHYLRINKINLSLKELDIIQLNKLSKFIKPSNFKSILNNKIKNGKLISEIEIFLNNEGSLENYIIKGSVFDLEANIYDNLNLSKTKFSFFADKDDILIKNKKLIITTGKKTPIGGIV